MKDFSEKMKNTLPSFPLLQDSSTQSTYHFSKKIIQDAYNSNAYQAIWYTSEQIKPVVDSLLNDWAYLTDIEGLKLDHTQEALQFIKNHKTSTHLDTIILNDIYLSWLYTQAVEKMLIGNTIPKINKNYIVDNDSIHNIDNPLEVIYKNADSTLNLWASYRSDIKEYHALLKESERWRQLQETHQIDELKKEFTQHKKQDIALQIMGLELNKSLIIDSTTQDIKNAQDIISQYQTKYAIKTSGELDETTKKIVSRPVQYYLDKIHLNLERLRWMPRSMGDEYIFVNIPLMELVYMKGDKAAFHSNVIVGKPARPTPSLSSHLTDIVFNPPWGVPPTILKNDVRPGVAKSGGAYLARKGLRAYDSRGRDVTHQVNGSNIGQYRIAQPPGANNALGEVKFNFPNTEAIFIHDTNNRNQFNNPYRALSSGCVRTDQPKVLAEIILKDKGYNQDKINDIIKTRKTEKVDVNKKIPIYIMYLTVHYDEKLQSVIYLTDIYNRDKG